MLPLYTMHRLTVDRSAAATSARCIVMYLILLGCGFNPPLTAHTLVRPISIEHISIEYLLSRVCSRRVVAVAVNG